MIFRTHRFANGLELVGEPIAQARSAAIGFYVRTGARDEMPAESGVSHFLEHMMFKGTPRRSAAEVNLDFDRIGASYNAFTSEELTAYYAAVLPEYMAPAVDVLTDILRPSLRQDDFDTEKQVILEEIGMYADMPSAAAFDRARETYFAGHPLGNSVLGTTESVTALSRDAMHAYFTRRYAPNNLVAVTAGNFDWDTLVKQIETTTGSWPVAKVGRDHVTAVPGKGGIHVYPKEGIAQEQLILLSTGPDTQSELRHAAGVLSVALGDDSGSRYYWSIVDPGKADSASCSLDQNEGNGSMISFLTCEPDDTQENLDILRGVLADVQKNGITEEELAAAKSKIASRVIRGSERPMGKMRAHAGSWLYRREAFDADAELQRYDAVTMNDIRATMNAFPLTNITVVAYGPVTSLS